MAHPTKIQLIKRQTSEQWYVNFPAALAQAMELDKRLNLGVDRRG